MPLNKKYIKPFKNLYILILLLFGVWMLFFDANSYLIHRDLNKEIKNLKAEKEYYKNEISKDNRAIKELKTEDGIEKLAREKYYMKRENEEIYIIEYQDSTANQKENE